MPSVTWSPRSQRDLSRLYDFLAANSQSAAQRAIKSIQQAVRLLESHPAAGRYLEDKPPEYREWIALFGNSAYVVCYRFDEHQVIILAVRHGREAGY